MAYTTIEALQIGGIFFVMMSAIMGGLILAYNLDTRGKNEN